ncbi:MAG: hypothetical protein P1U39_08745 [Legionellaceae bacterium]|nr:hypothetical protein [Legionellaceae bacterium]
MSGDKTEEEFARIRIEEERQQRAAVLAAELRDLDLKAHEKAQLVNELQGVINLLALLAAVPGANPKYAKAQQELTEALNHPDLQSSTPPVLGGHGPAASSPEVTPPTPTTVIETPEQHLAALQALDEKLSKLIDDPRVPASLKEVFRTLQENVKRSIPVVEEQIKDASVESEFTPTASTTSIPPPPPPRHRSESLEVQLAEQRRVAHSEADRAEAAEQEAEELRKELHLSREAMERQRRVMEEMERERDEASYRANELESEVTAVEAESARLQTDVTAGSDRITDLEEQLRASQAQVVSFEVQLASIRAESEQRQGQLAAATTRADGLQTQLTEATNRVGVLESEVTTGRQQIEELESQLETLRVDVQAQIKAATAAAKQEAEAAAQARIAVPKSQLESPQTRPDSEQDKRKKALSENEKLKQENQQLKEKLGRFDENLGRALAELETFRRCNSAGVERAQKAEAKAKELQKQLERLQNETPQPASAGNRENADVGPIDASLQDKVSRLKHELGAAIFELHQSSPGLVGGDDGFKEIIEGLQKALDMLAAERKVRAKALNRGENAASIEGKMRGGFFNSSSSQGAPNSSALSSNQLGPDASNEEKNDGPPTPGRR